MKTIEYKSIKINNINEKNDYDGRYIKTTTTTTYDMNNIFDHKIKCNIIVIIFQHFIYFLFRLLAYSISFTLFINLFIAFLYALICEILLRVLPNFEYSYLGYWRTYLITFPFCYLFFLFFSIYLAKGFTLDYHLKIESLKQRGYNIKNFKEKTFDKNYKIILYKDWDSFISKLK